MVNLDTDFLESFKLKCGDTEIFDSIFLRAEGHGFVRKEAWLLYLTKKRAVCGYAALP